MKQFLQASDSPSLDEWIDLGLKLKSSPQLLGDIHRGKTIGLLFFNPSLRTRMSTQRAAFNLGMNCMVMNIGSDGWQLEFEDGSIMNGNTAEHIKEAAGVLSQYCDIIGIRAFPELISADKDYEERILKGFAKYATVPIVSLESATNHPLQALADLMTIRELKTVDRPKIVLTWAPHPRVLPQAVPNAFAQFVLASNIGDLIITHPEGMDLHPDFTKGAKIEYNQDEALKDADFVYAKNWSSFQNYGQRLDGHEDWTITGDKMKLTNDAKFMHCLPVRRNVVVTDEVLDGDQSAVLVQAANRIYSVQAVIHELLK